MPRYFRLAWGILLVLSVAVVAKAQVDPIPPLYPTGTILSSADLSIPVIELLRGYRFHDEQRGLQHELTWKEGTVAVRFTIDHSMIDIVLNRVPFPRIQVEVEARAGGSAFHVAFYFLDFSIASDVNQLFEILKSEGALPRSEGGSHRVLLNKVSHWRERARRLLMESEFQSEDRQFNFRHEAEGFGKNFRSYRAQVHLYDYLMAEGVLCDLELIDHRGLRSRVLLVVNQDSDFSVLEAITHSLRSREKREVLADMRDFETGDFYQKAIERFSINRSKRVLATIRETLLAINPTGRELSLSQLHDGQRLMLAEYLSRAFCDRYGHSPTLRQTLQEIRESTHGVVMLEDLDMERNIDLQIKLGEVLHSLGWDVSHPEARVRFKRVFMLEVLKYVRER